MARARGGFRRACHSARMLAHPSGSASLWPRGRHASPLARYRHMSVSLRRKRSACAYRCHRCAIPCNGLCKAQAERLRRKKGIGIRDEQRGRARRISRGAGDPERGGTAQTGAEARRRGRGRYSDPFHAPASTHGCAALRRERDRWRSRDAPKCRQRASCNRGKCRDTRRTARGWRCSREELAAEGNLTIAERGEGKADAPQAAGLNAARHFPQIRRHGKIGTGNGEWGTSPTRAIRG